MPIRLWSKIRWPASCARVIRGEHSRPRTPDVCLQMSVGKKPNKGTKCKCKCKCVCLWCMSPPPNLLHYLPKPACQLLLLHLLPRLIVRVQKDPKKKISCVASPMAERDLRFHESIKKCVNFEQHEVYMWVLFGSFFHVLQLLPIRYTQHNYLCCVNKSTVKHMQKSDWKSGLFLFSYGY